MRNLNFTDLTRGLTLQPGEKMSEQGTVLVVEDQENERRNLSQMLRLQGFRVYSTPDPE